MFRAILPLEPVGRPRQRHRVVTPKDLPSYVQSYTPEDGPYAEFARPAVLLLHSARRGQPALVGPVGLKAVLLFKMPKGEHRKRKPRPRRWHVSKPDVDNVLKAVMDCMVAAGWMADDTQVAQVEVQKFVAAQGQPASVHVTLFSLPSLEFVPAPTAEIS